MIGIILKFKKTQPMSEAELIKKYLTIDKTK